MYFWYTFHETVVYYVANWKMKIVSNDIGNLYSIKKKKIGDGWDCFPQKMIDPPLHPSDNKTVRFFFLQTQYIFFSNEPLFFCRFENNSDSRNIADKMKAFFWKGHPFLVLAAWCSMLHLAKIAVSQKCFDALSISPGHGHYYEIIDVFKMPSLLFAPILQK